MRRAGPSGWRAAEWRHHLHIGAARAGTNLEAAAHLPDSFAHSRDANSDPRQGQDSVALVASPLSTLFELFSSIRRRKEGFYSNRFKGL